MLFPLFCYQYTNPLGCYFKHQSLFGDFPTFFLLSPFAQSTEDVYAIVCLMGLALLNDIFVSLETLTKNLGVMSKLNEEPTVIIDEANRGTIKVLH